jgi:acetyltransferase-like isoleucine patch superfamily enzyme
MKNFIRNKIYDLFCLMVPEIRELRWLRTAKGHSIFESEAIDTETGQVKIFAPYNIRHCKIGKGTYVARNSFMSHVEIGKYCSIGPNLICGWGDHPLEGITTSPVFYSTQNQAGFYYASENKVEERKTIKIGNDVLIGMNVSILDGVHIGNGAVIGAGAVVSKDIPPYAIAYGSPIKIARFRFSDEQIKRMEEIRWWDFDDEKIKDVERYFFDIEAFINKYDPPAPAPGLA